MVDHAAFFVPLVFIAVLWRARAHFLAHPVALVSLVLLTLVSILHFDVGMLATDPYDTSWTISVRPTGPGAQA